MKGCGRRADLAVLSPARRLAFKRLPLSQGPHSSSIIRHTPCQVRRKEDRKSALCKAKFRVIATAAGDLPTSFF
jgi:hypothetical protein